MIRKLFISFLLLSALLSTRYSFAQSFDEYRKRMMAEFDSYRDKTRREFEDYRKRVNAEYAEFMKRAWTEMKVRPEIPAPQSDPPTPYVYRPEDDRSVPIAPVFADVIDPPVVKPLPKPLIPISVADVTEPVVNVTFFGAECRVHVAKESFMVDMKDNSEKSVSKVWTLFSDGRADILINDCFILKDKLRLCDWAYFQLVKRISAEIYGSDDCGEAVVLQAYLMTQSGYKVRIGRVNNGLRLLLSSDSVIYATSYLQIGGVNFYSLQEVNGPIYICNFEFPAEVTFSLRVDKLPLLPVDEIAGRELQAKRYADAKAVVNHNRNMIDFLDTFPNCSIENYAYASIDDEVKKTLYPALKQAVDGADEDVAANILINFVQTAFEYKVDGDQFGCERTLFPSETLYYPYSDCEDRALLYATLVKELLGLDVVLLDYPDHIATAVHFTHDVEGDCIQVGDKKYLVCDPTYIGADIGHCMPRYRESAVHVINIER